jgi:hypothetical protein
MSERKKIIVHIGMAKTGSTAIQYALFEARERLRALGIAYAATDRERDVDERHLKHGHLCAVAWKGQAGDIERARADVLAQLAEPGVHTLVISSEGLSGPGRRAAEFFKPLAAMHDVHAVCYLRRQDLFIESYFNQIVKRDRDEAYPRDIVAFAGSPSIRRRMQYHVMLGRWREAGIRVSVFDHAQAVAGGNLVAHFAAAAGLHGVELENQRRNPSPDMRAILAVCALRQSGERPDAREIILAAERLNGEAGPPLKHLLGRRLRGAVLAECRDGNDRLARDYGIRFSTSLPEGEGDAPLQAPPPGYLSLLMARMGKPVPAVAAEPAPATEPAAAASGHRPGCVYIYTIPKSGTYLMSAFVHALGWANSGWHVELGHVLRTLEHDPQANRERPSQSRVPGSYLHSLRALPEGQHAFGHVNPLYVPTLMLRDKGYRMLAVRRHPREVLVSEFVDFRHRRRDVEWVSEARVPDHATAFGLYLRQHGPVVRNICQQYLLLQQVHALADYEALCGGPRVLFMDIAAFLDDTSGPDTACRIADFLGSGLAADEVARLRTQALAADNKTKATGLALPYAREALWTPEAEAAYAALGFDDLARRLGCC